MNLEKYYRLFYLPAHYSDWQAKRFNSYHDSICGNWMEIYKSGSRNPSDYPLQQREGKYTEQAVLNFLALNNKYKAGDIWSREDRESASQLDGVCAFKDLDSVIRFANGGASEGRAIVIFEGIWVSDIPESDGGDSGALVKPIQTFSLKPLKEYRKET